jgi:hypothetical protein
MRGLEPWRHGKDVRVAPQQEPGGDEQHDRQRNLRDDERIADALSAEPAGRASRTGLQHRVERDARRDHRRAGAEHENDQRRHGGREEQHRDVERRLGSQRQAARHQPREVPERERRERDADDGARSGKHGALREQLADHTRVRCADGLPERELSLAARGPRQQQIRHVDARNQQDEHDGANQHGHRRSRVARQLFVERH